MTAAHKIYSNDKRIVWHRIGDVVRVDDRARVWIYGRKSHACTWQDEYYYPIAVESLFNHLENVRRTALVNVKINGETKLALVIEPVIRGRNAMQRSVFVERAKKWNLPLEHFYVYPSIFPVDPRHNAKIDRPKLSRWAQKNEGMH
jgi:acyl-coenzyme A synthetase/AMP-(fatty) acid ligase